VHCCNVIPEKGVVARKDKNISKKWFITFKLVNLNQKLFHNIFQTERKTSLSGKSSCDGSN